MVFPWHIPHMKRGLIPDGAAVPRFGLATNWSTVHSNVTGFMVDTLWRTNIAIENGHL